MNYRAIVPFLMAFIFCLTSAAGAAGADGKVSLPPDPAQVEGLKERMVGDPEIMGLILILQSEPEMQALLNDPVTKEALQSGDLDALVADPRFIKLLANPKVRDIEQHLR